MPSTPYKIYAIGRIRIKEDRAWIEVDNPYREAMLGLEGFSHILVFYWLHANDTQKQRAILQVHPRKNPRNPLTGVFATHAPVRPNLIAMTRCRILGIRSGRIDIEKIDAHDGSPLLDIKCYIPSEKPDTLVRVPSWVSEDEGKTAQQ